MDERLKIFIASFAIAILVFAVSFSKPKNAPIISRIAQRPGVVPMPLVLDTDPITSSQTWGAPYANRGVSVRKYLSASLKISVQGASGSGTIIYFDRATGYAYVASCGHLWNGTMSAQNLQGRQVTCTVTTWYHNEKKLDRPRDYEAEVLWWSNNRGYDSSLLRFKPDWANPMYFPIAPLNYSLPAGKMLHSCGCDHGSEAANYDVEVVGPRGSDLVTQQNSPRPGRSGGGLMTDDGYYVGICWGTSNTDGSGIGLFTPLNSIYAMYSSNGCEWLTHVSPPFLARALPIRSNVLGKTFNAEFVPLPGGELVPIE